MPAPRRLSVLAVVLIAAAAAVPGAASAAAADTVTVASCTETAFRAAVATVPDGGTVDFGCDGTIAITLAAGGAIQLPRSMTIDGSGHFVTLDGGDQTSLLVNSFPQTLTLRHLTLSHAQNRDGNGIGLGGAVITNGLLTVDDVDFRDNLAGTAGGAIWASGPGTVVTNSRFVDNAADCDSRAIGSAGGAIFVSTLTPLSVSSSSFVGNRARCDQGAAGGAIFGGYRNLNTYWGTPPLPPGTPYPAPYGKITVTDSIFERNVATRFVSDAFSNASVAVSGGGAVTAFNRSLSIQRSAFDRNAMISQGQAEGGAVFAAGYGGSTLDIAHTSFRGNSNQDPDDPAARPTQLLYGGAVATFNVRASVTASTFTGNAALAGGALVAFAADVAVADSVFTANVGARSLPGHSDNFAYGGALYLYGTGFAVPGSGPVYTSSTATVAGTTFTRNSPATCQLGPQARVELDATSTDDMPGSCQPPAVPTVVPAGSATLTLPSAPVGPGASVPLAISGFAPGAAVTVAAIPTAGGGPPVQLEQSPGFQSIATTDGSFAGDVTGPSTPGVYRVVVLGEAAGYSGVRAFAGVLVVAAPGQAVAPVVTTEPDATTVAAGRPASFTASAAGSPSPTVQWQRSVAGGGFVDVPGATGATLTLPAQGLDDSGTAVRAVFSSSAGTATSDPATLAVTPLSVTVTSAGAAVASGATVAPGAQIVARVTGAPAGPVIVTSPSGTVLGSATVGADGTASVAAAAPTTQGPAVLTLRAGGVVVARFPLSIAAPNPNPNPSPITTTPPTGTHGATPATTVSVASGRGELALTGTDAGSLSIVGVVLLLAGGGLIVSARRRRPGAEPTA